MQPDFSRDARIAPILTRIAQLLKKPRLTGFSWLVVFLPITIL